MALEIADDKPNNREPDNVIMRRETGQNLISCMKNATRELS